VMGHVRQEAIVFVRFESRLSRVSKRLSFQRVLCPPLYIQRLQFLFGTGLHTPHPRLSCIEFKQRRRAQHGAVQWRTCRCSGP